MTEYDAMRLTKQDGTVVAYFAPNFKITPIMKNDLKNEPMPYERGTKVRNILKWTEEFTVQGQFEHSENLPDDHKTALESLFGKSPVTARDQVNRVKWAAKSYESAFYFYDNTDEYTATSPSEADYKNGVFPTVFIDEFRPPRTGGHSRMEYMTKFIVGLEI